MNLHPTISVEGVIGVGKTTLARLMKPAFGAQLVLEEFEENPFLADFYGDRVRYAFQTQIFFLLSRYRQQQSLATKRRRLTLVSDYTFMKDRLFAQLNLGGDELEVYQHVYSALAVNIPQPDLVVFLRAGSHTLMERIAVRDRPYERDMDRSYIVALNQAYEDFFATYSDSPLLVIDTDGLNIVANPEDLDTVIGRIRAAIGREVRQDPLPNLNLQDSLSQAASEPRLTHFQQFHTALDADKGFLTNVYFNFICLQEEFGELAAVLKEVWSETSREHVDHEQAIARRLPALQDELADCLAYLLKLSNYLGIDLEDAYLEKMKHNVDRSWPRREELKS